MKREAAFGTTAASRIVEAGVGKPPFLALRLLSDFYYIHLSGQEGWFIHALLLFQQHFFRQFINQPDVQPDDVPVIALYHFNEERGATQNRISPRLLHRLRRRHAR